MFGQKIDIDEIQGGGSYIKIKNNRIIAPFESQSLFENKHKKIIELLKQSTIKLITS